MSVSKGQVYAVLGALIVGLAVGRFAAPTKVVTKTEVKDVEKKVEKKTTDSQKNKKNNKIVIVVETVMPDGTRRKETKIVDRGSITIDNSSTEERESDRTTETKTEKIVERSHDGLLIYGLAAAQLTDWAGGLEFGGGVQKRLLGPFWLGAYGTNKATVGVTVGVSF